MEGREEAEKRKMRKDKKGTKMRIKEKGGKERKTQGQEMRKE